MFNHNIIKSLKLSREIFICKDQGSNPVPQMRDLQAHPYLTKNGQRKKTSEFRCKMISPFDLCFLMVNHGNSWT